MNALNQNFPERLASVGDSAEPCDSYVGVLVAVRPRKLEGTLLPIVIAMLHIYS